MYYVLDRLNLCQGLQSSFGKSRPEVRVYYCSAVSWVMVCDAAAEDPADAEKAREKELLLWTLHFTTQLIEHSFSRHLYSSMEHLTALLASSDLGMTSLVNFLLAY